MSIRFYHCTLVVLRKPSIGRIFPGGVEASKAWQDIEVEDDPQLLGLGFMSGREARRFSITLWGMGFRVGRDFGLGDGVLGEVWPCDGIRFRPVGGEEPLWTGWKAVAVMPKGSGVAKDEWLFA